MDIQALLKEAGPYTAPLCVAMAWALKWFASDRTRILKSLSESSARERSGQERRTYEALDSARLLAESNKSQTETLRDHDRMIEKLVERWDRWLLSKD